ncbi:hypothetical protein N9795_01185 [Candidatus Pelagibacter sp.]|nr:hypothetical protein [Candidatus Pelagibacter sp.]
MSQLYPSLQGTITKNSRGGGSASPTPFFFARVNDILVSPKTKTNNFFQDAGGWAGLGSVKFTPIGTTVDTGTTTKLIAKPLFTNIIQYPILNEIVMVFQAPSNDLNTDPQAKTYYYLNTVGVWNSVHHNIFPDINTFNKKIAKDLPENEILSFGNSFSEKGDIRNLLPEEGDVMVEGRWGNSIRFSSTTPQKQPNNSWSSQGEIGSPITVIRNGQSKIDINPEPWVPVYEDINFDGSSIYMCSGQEIPLELASKNLTSFGVTVGAAFNSALQIPDPYLKPEDQSPKDADNLK